ncbi:glycosyltransferase [Dokdonella soli]|uniref:Glycosyltransferase n=1 Tax=Dokdonella soli TaxID=529810 RepID=A0ABP3TS87_9GAMM
MSLRPALVLVTTSFPIHGDGSEAAGSFVSDLAEDLAQHVPIRVVAPGQQSVREEWAPGFEVFRYASPAKPLSTLKPWRPLEACETIRVLREGAQATRRAVEAGPTAHIFALWVLPSGYWARSAARASGVPYSVWALGSDIWSLGKIPGVRTVLRSVIRGAANRFADGLELGQDATRIGGRPFTFLPSTRRLEGQRTRPLASTPPYRFLFLGRWHQNKGIDLLLDALALLDDHDWTRISEVRIAGGGPMETLVRERVQALEAAQRPVRLSGFLDRVHATAALADADYLLLPSRIESIPVVFSDAMKMQLPVVSMPVGDLPGLIIDHGIGHMASDVTADAFARAMRGALDRAPCHCSQALSRMESRFDMNTVVVPEILRLLPDRQQDQCDV